jgi:ankyrin repeat protein
MANNCQRCNKDFATPSSLTRHNIAKHPGNTSTAVRHGHQCSSCNAKFVRKETLQRHIGSKHTRQLMKRCQFCLENFREDYFHRHQWRCARKYWTKVCNNASLTSQIQSGQSIDFSGPAARRNTFPDAQPIPAAEDCLRVVHEIDINVRLVSDAFDLMFLHCRNIGDIDSCLEAITASLRLSVPIEPDIRELSLHDPFLDLLWLALAIGKYVRGKRNINDEDADGDTLMDLACRAGAADLIEPLFWRGAAVNDRTLLQAIESESFDTVRFCLALGADPNSYSSELSYSNDEPSPLNLASVDSETSHIVSLLIEYGATVFVRDSDGETPLHLAAQRADVDLLHVLLAVDPSPDFLDANNIEGYSALDFAIQSIGFGRPQGEALDFATALLDAGAEADWLDYDNSALCCAVQSGCRAIVRLLLSREPESPRKLAYLNEALRQTIYHEVDEVIEILVEAGATVDVKTLEHFLVCASLGKVESLLKAGARVDRIGDVVLKCLFEAAQDQRLSGIEEAEDARRKFRDAVAKYELLCLYFPDDERLRDLHSGTGVEDFGF